MFEKTSDTTKLARLGAEYAYDERRCPIGGGDTTVVRDSDPKSKVVPIVLIHALALDRRMWDDVFDRLVAGGGGGGGDGDGNARDDVRMRMRVISYDLRGHGEAADAAAVATSGQADVQAPVKDLEHLADDLRVLLDDCGVQQADIHGQSYGGAVAQYFALKYPERTRSLGLITTAGQSQASWVSRATRAEEARSVKPLMDETLARWFSAEVIARDDEGVRYARSRLERIGVKNWAAAWRAMSGLNTLDKLDKLKDPSRGFRGPVLIVCGIQDASTGPEHMRRLRDAWEACCSQGTGTGTEVGVVQYKELDPGVHMMALEQGEALAKEILEFRRFVDGMD